MVITTKGSTPKLPLTGVLAATRNMDKLTKLESPADLEILLDGKNYEAIYIDIDTFHMVMYQFGYQVGDEYLIKIAIFLKSLAIKHNLRIFRVGGDEFLIVYLSDVKYMQREISEGVEALRLKCEYGDGLSNYISVSSIAFTMNYSSYEEFKTSLDLLSSQIWYVKKNGGIRNVHLRS